jgi:hypothetical protein
MVTSLTPAGLGSNSTHLAAAAVGLAETGVASKSKIIRTNLLIHVEIIVHGV